MDRPEVDDYYEEDESAEEIFERFDRGEGGLTSLPPGGQVLSTPAAALVSASAGHAGGQDQGSWGNRSVWSNAGYSYTHNDSLVQA